jgi:hypothetical protein
MLVKEMRDHLHLTDILLKGLSEEPNRDFIWGRRDDSSEAGWDRLLEAEEVYTSWRKSVHK